MISKHKLKVDLCSQVQNLNETSLKFRNTKFLIKNSASTFSWISSNFCPKVKEFPWKQKFTAWRSLQFCGLVVKRKAVFQIKMPRLRQKIRMLLLNVIRQLRIDRKNSLAVLVNTYTINRWKMRIFTLCRKLCGRQEVHTNSNAVLGTEMNSFYTWRSFSDSLNRKHLREISPKTNYANNKASS